MLIKIILIFILTTVAHAGCDTLQITNIANSINLNSNIAPKVDFNIFRADSNGKCKYRVGVDRGSSASYNRTINFSSNQMSLAFSKSNSMNTVLKDPAEANNTNEYIFGEMKNKEQQLQLSFYAELTLNPNVPAGYYTDTFNLKLYQFTGNTLVLKDTHAVEFFYNIPDQVAVSLVNTNAPFDINDTNQDINFGTMYSGASQKMDIVIQSNTGYTLDISSTNNGNIKHISHSSTIGYTFKANGQIKNLAGSSSTPVTISTGSGTHSGDGFRVPLEFTIQDTSNKVSGEYKDYLTIAVTSNL